MKGASPPLPGISLDPGQLGIEEFVEPSVLFSLSIISTGPLINRSFWVPPVSMRKSLREGSL